VTSARRIVNDLRPPMLENLGLVPALQALAADFAKQTGTACEVVADAALERGDAVPMDVATCLYRVVQEALNNVRKHAQARRVCVTLTLGPGADYQLRVADDGLGIRDGDRGKPESLGLLGMQERVHALGGSLGVSGASGFGTGIDVQIPGATAPAAPDPRAAPAVQVQARVQRARAARDGGAAQASQDQRRPS